ncbi:hypothetical protein F5890DRAFT_1556155 [Lentinula detonsa]|uniref:Uncharacterized protein n=1 Tax=Lentinula detonsa TaxID=2804962 RepID=A0AA38PUQ9_9AGAR|nr:hypothetical protein F5890DRAFT_1556155 [Lentinula detonsa]
MTENRDEQEGNFDNLASSFDTKYEDNLYRVDRERRTQPPKDSNNITFVRLWEISSGSRSTVTSFTRDNGQNIFKKQLDGGSQQETNRYRLYWKIFERYRQFTTAQKFITAREAGGALLSNLLAQAPKGENSNVCLVIHLDEAHTLPDDDHTKDSVYYYFTSFFDQVEGLPSWRHTRLGSPTFDAWLSLAGALEKKFIVPVLIDSEKKIEESNIDALFWKIRLRERVTRNYFDPSKFAFFPQESVDLRPSASFVLYLGVSNVPHVPRVVDLTKTNAKPKAETTTLAQSSTDSHQRYS